MQAKIQIGENGFFIEINLFLSNQLMPGHVAQIFNAFFQRDGVIRQNAIFHILCMFHFHALNPLFCKRQQCRLRMLGTEHGAGFSAHLRYGIFQEINRCFLVRAIGIEHIQMNCHGIMFRIACLNLQRSDITQRFKHIAHRIHE